jgi:hypothetical protein
MSASGHKRTFALQKAMSPLPPKADIEASPRDVFSRATTVIERRTARRNRTASAVGFSDVLKVGRASFERK